MADAPGRSSRPAGRPSARLRRGRVAVEHPPPRTPRVAYRAPGRRSSTNVCRRARRGRTRLRPSSAPAARGSVTRRPRRHHVQSSPIQPSAGPRVLRSPVARRPLVGQRLDAFARHLRCRRPRRRRNAAPRCAAGAPAALNPSSSAIATPPATAPERSRSPRRRPAAPSALLPVRPDRAPSGSPAAIGGRYRPPPMARPLARSHKTSPEATSSRPCSPPRLTRPRAPSGRTRSTGARQHRRSPLCARERLLVGSQSSGSPSSGAPPPSPSQPAGD